METAEIVKVAVSAAPYSIDRPYDYLIPPDLTERAVPGVRVTVPFGRGNRTSEGIVLSRGQGEKSRGLKPLLSVLDREPVLDSDGIALALWLRQRYFCTMFEAVKTVLPAGLWYQIREVWHLAEGMDRYTAGRPGRRHPAGHPGAGRPVRRRRNRGADRHRGNLRPRSGDRPAGAAEGGDRGL